ncbi:Putative Ig domain-containing protein [Jatrophihabitans endophyticus]|uniref:Putative Ig domain-containing protein n=1 Tax=Jatrophihabitans endophyticus TaxID=1206085 RepID=A0A1M5KAC3_9ACTN|nr:putative Ig domain-containing protein [Jatrophihabitans endophyticus]SHG49550.1 Putative Ig domain-containing protein [Jatrophihabitans endophyticus]
MFRIALPSRRRTTAGIAVGALALTTAAVLTATPAAAAGATLNVTTTADIAANAGACGNSSVTTAPSPLSLREATCLANNIGGSVTIDVPAGTYNLSNGELQLGSAAGQNASIVGAGSASTIIDAGGNSRVLDLDFNLTGGVTTNISGLTIRNGADETYGGAGIIGGSNLNSSADALTLTGVVLTDNHANAASPTVTNRPGGAVQFFGGQLTITNSVIRNNSAGSSYGSGVAYGANGDASPEGLTVTGTTFTGNSGTNADTSAGTKVGGALEMFGTSGSNFSIANSRFINNSVTSNSGTTSPVGAGIWQQSGNLTVTESTFTGNSVSGGTGTPSGGAIAATGGTLTMHYNRVVGNIASAGSGLYASGSVNATDNWWGCNTGPNTTGCDTTSGGTVTAAPRLVLSGSASPAKVTGPNATSTITASFVSDSAGTNVVTSNLDVFETLPVTFSDPPGDATVTTSAGSHTKPFGSGSASIDFHSNTTAGNVATTLAFDNAIVNVPVEVDQAPAITSANSTTFAIGQAGSFTVTTTGYPSPAITETGSLPSGLTFTDNGDGTATIAGTPTGSGGTYPLNLTANNGISPNATQTLTLSVGQPPAFTSPATATFKIGTAGSFTVTTSGVPTVSTITESGTLPSGLTFTDNGDGTATIAGTPTGTGNTYPVTLTATNGVSPNGTQALTVQVNQAPAVTSNPADQTVQPGTSVSFSAAASGVPTPSVQWQRSTDGGTSFANLAGATATTYTHTATAAENGYLYRAVFTNAAGTATTTAATLNVGTAPAFTSADYTRFGAGRAGSFTVTTSGVPNATLSRTGSGFPSWLTLTDNGDGTGTLTGTPPAGSGGAYTFTLKAANGFSPSASQNFTLFVDESPVITSTDHATFTVGSAGSFAVTTTAGYPTATRVTRTGALPSGVTFVDNGNGTATLAGNPAPGTGGTYPVTITADNAGTAPATTQSFTLTVNESPAITSPDHAIFAVGTAGSFTVTADNGYPAPPALTETGTLPGGLTFTDNGDGTATLDGTPRAGTGGVYTMVVTAGNGHSTDATQTFTLTVNESARITSADHADFTKGTASTFTVTTAGGQPSTVTLSETGALPRGLSFSDNGDGTATIAGTPTESGVFGVTITASNGVQPDATQSFTLTVAGPPTITSPDTATFRADQDSFFTITTAAGTPARTTISIDGALPRGFAFVDNGDGTAGIAGNTGPHGGGRFPVTVTADNGVAPADTQTLTLIVNDPPVITSPATATFIIGAAGSQTVTTVGYPTAALTETGALPAGVTFVDNGDGTGTLAGTPDADTQGTYPVTLTAANGVGADDVQSFTLVVAKKAQAITVTSTVPDSPVVGGSYALAATADSGLPVAFTVDGATSGYGTTGQACAISDGGRVLLQHVGHCRIDYTQGGNGTYAAAPTVSDDFDIAAIATTTTVSSSQASSVYGQPVRLHAVVAAGSQFPKGTVQFSVAGDKLGDPVPVDGAGAADSVALTDTHGDALVPGSYAVRADFTPADPTTYAVSGAGITQVVNQAATTTKLAVTDTQLSATVAPVAPGAGAPSGDVVFSVAGAKVGSAPVTDGVATLDYRVPAGQARQVAAQYGGDERFTGSSDSVARRDPRITATVSSRTKPTRFGWYRTPVTVSFRCTTNGSPLVGSCPKSVTLSRSAAAQSVTRTIAAADGGMATVTVRGIDIDRSAPAVRVSGVRNGATYYGAAPTARCVGKDGLSGVASCRLTKRTSGVTTRYRATVTDKAGNTRTVTGSYRTSGIVLAGTRFTKGAWDVKPGKTYTIVVYANSRPRYYDAAVYPKKPFKRDSAFHKAGKGRWTLGVTMDRIMRTHTYWNLGVKVGATLHRVKVRARH